MLHEQGAVTFHLLGGGNGQKSNLQKPLYITGVMRTHTHADEQVSSYLFGERTKAHAADHFIALHQRQRATIEEEGRGMYVI